MSPKPSQQILVALYEEEGLSPELIAADQQVEVSYVIATLMQFSGKYKLETRQLGSKEDVSQEEFDLVRERYKSLALHTQDEHLMEKALRFLWNEKKGRNDGVNNPKPPVLNIGTFNVLLQRAREAKEKALEAEVV